MSETPAPILVLCRDLLFTSKITATAKAVNIPVQIIRDATKLYEQRDSTRLLVDLGQGGYLEAAAEWKKSGDRHVSGFVSHTDTAAIAAAKAAGFDQIFSRGTFTANLESILLDRSNAKSAE